MDWINTMFSPAVQDAAKGLFDLALLALIGYGAQQLRRRRIIDLDRKMQDDIHRALTTGVRAALSGRPLGEITAEFQEQAILAAIAYARKSVPDALNNIANGRPMPLDVLGDMARAKLSEVHTEMMGQNKI